MNERLGFQIDLTYRCNLKCPFCGYTKEKAIYRSGKQLDFDSVKNILTQISNLKPKWFIDNIWYVGTGETLLHKNLPEIIMETTKKIGSFVGVVTNGTLLTKKMSEKLIKAGVTEIDISITGASAEIYSNHQGAGDGLEDAQKKFELVSHNIYELCELKNYLRVNTIIAISYILHEGSKSDFFKALNHWRNIGVDFVFTRTMIGDNTQNVKKKIEKIDTKLIKKGLICQTFMKLMQITIEGNVHICCVLNNDTIIGNVFEKPLEEIVNSNKFRKLIEAFYGKYNEIPKYCKRCPYLGVTLRDQFD